MNAIVGHMLCRPSGPHISSARRCLVYSMTYCVSTGTWNPTRERLYILWPYYSSTARRCRQPVNAPDCGHAGRSLTSFTAVPREVLRFRGPIGRRPTLPADLISQQAVLQHNSQLQLTRSFRGDVLYLLIEFSFCTSISNNCIST